jgi:hypothetical protein
VTLSHIFDKHDSSEIGRLFEAISGSPSLCSGTTSAIFHIEEYVDVIKEQLIISVTGSKITSSKSLIN